MCLNDKLNKPFVISVFHIQVILYLFPLSVDTEFRAICVSYFMYNSIFVAR